MNSRLFHILLWVVISISVIVVLGFVNKNQDDIVLKKPIINIDYETENRFISENDILSQIINPGDSSKKLISSFDVFEIETKINNNSSVKEAEVYRTIDGQLVVNVKQRRPIVRVYTATENYYIDEKGFLMPTSKKYTARVPIVNGFVRDSFGKGSAFNYANLSDSLTGGTMLDDIYKIAKYIDGSLFWKAQIEQIYVNKDLELELVPKVGNHKIVLGGIERFENKFNKLMIFYQKGLKKTGWNEYSEINLKYKDQVVCKKIYN